MLRGSGGCRWRRAADVHIRDIGAVRGLAAEQAAAGRDGRVPAGARAQGNAGGAAPRPAAPAPGARARPRALAAPPHALPRVGAAAPPQLPGGAAVPQLLLSVSAGGGARRPPDLCPPFLSQLEPAAAEDGRGDADEA